MDIADYVAVVAQALLIAVVKALAARVIVNRALEMIG